MPMVETIRNPSEPSLARFKLEVRNTVFTVFNSAIHRLSRTSPHPRSKIRRPVSCRCESERTWWDYLRPPFASISTPPPNVTGLCCVGSKDDAMGDLILPRFLWKQRSCKMHAESA